MENTASDVKVIIGKFADTVDTLIATIDAEIGSGEFSDAELAANRMRETLNGIVDAMVKREHCTSYEATMIKNFINYIVSDKKKIISDKRYISTLEYHVSNNVFREEEEKWKEYTTPPFDKDPHHVDSKDSHQKNKWAYDDDEDDL